MQENRFITLYLCLTNLLMSLLNIKMSIYLSPELYKHIKKIMNIVKAIMI